MSCDVCESKHDEMELDLVDCKCVCHKRKVNG